MHFRMCGWLWWENLDHLVVLVVGLLVLVARRVTVEVHEHHGAAKASGEFNALTAWRVFSREAHFGMAPRFDVSDDDSPVPPTRVVGRFSASSLTRAAAFSPKPRPTASVAVAPKRPTKAELLVRAQQVDRMATALNANRAQAPKAPVAAPAAAAPAAPAADNDMVADLQLAEHLAALNALAVPPPDSSAERAVALAAALAASSSSLSLCEQQQAEELQASVQTLKDTFRSRLEGLEAEFVRRAQALSDELAGAVAECKQEGADALALHADTLAATLLRIREGDDTGVGVARSIGARAQPSLLPPRPAEALPAVATRLASADVGGVWGSPMLGGDGLGGGHAGPHEEGGEADEALPPHRLARAVVHAGWESSDED